MAGATTLISGYGAFEIKRAYRKNMIIGIAIACLAISIIICIWTFVIGFEMEPPVIDENPIEKHIWEISIAPPPPIDRSAAGNLSTGPPPPEFSAGLIVKVHDDEINDEPDIPTTDELKEAILKKAVNNFSEFESGNVIISKETEFLPPRDSFVAYEEAPIIIENMLPIYPEIARRAGIEGVVWVSVLLDKNGNVHDVQISKESGVNAGFEEAAVEAARQTVWKPAISNGQPVALWVSYKIVFSLKDGRR